MPAVLNDIPCDACFGRHTLCFPARCLGRMAELRVRLPAARRTVQLPLSAGNKPSGRVRGAVILRKVT